MGTRSGDIDPAIISFIAAKEGIDAEKVIDICNKKSGVLGLSGGVSSDFRDLDAAGNDGNQLAIDALETYAYRVAKYIGSYMVAMGGCDVIAFTAGVGENNSKMRAAICEYLEFLGVEIDVDKNALRGEETVISKPGNKITVVVVPTNEELAIARETLRLVE